MIEKNQIYDLTNKKIRIRREEEDEHRPILFIGGVARSVPRRTFQ